MSERVTLTEAEREALGGPGSPWMWDDWDGLLHTVERILADRLADAWPCANYLRPRTCLTLRNTVGICDWCRDATTDLRARLAAVEALAADERGGRQVAAEAADRFRDVVSEALGLDENPGDDALVRDLRAHFGKTGPEPRRWRDFLDGQLTRLGPADTARLRGDS